MTRLLIIPALAVAATACVATTQGRLGARAGGPELAADDDAAPPPVAEAGEARGSGHAPDEDEHWFTAEDYLVSEKPYEGKPRLWIRQGKMMERPNASTKAEARFLTVDGKERWTASYWRSRVALERDLEIGALAFCPLGGGRTPTRKEDARRINWVLGAVTDISDLYKGLISIGTRACEVRAVRVPIE